ncbi:MAG: flagellar export chaperone FliS [Synergistota bacterium]|nr:flagellar export chaperone FliS [Synergistota bacterium]OPZ36936.1 MAG: Flagellar protein FliS [Synergistetes bacterium ADurb.BinA166]
MDSKNSQHAQAVYMANKVNTASREQLLLFTYDIGIRSCIGAENALEAGVVDEANNNIQRAQNVIRELMITLRVDEGGEVAQNLMRLYDFMYLMLVEANVAKDREKVSVVRGMLEELRSTWEEAIIKLAEESGEKAAPQFLRGSASAVKDDAKAVPAGGLNVAG